MSHHFDSAAALADERIDPCDLYAFPAAPDTTALVVTGNPDAGRSSRQHFGPTRPAVPDGCPADDPQGCGEPLPDGRRP